MCKTTEVNEIEIASITELTQKAGDGTCWNGFLNGGQTLKAEDRVVQIARAVAILKTSVGIETTVKKGGDEIARFTELLRRQPRHLQHFEPQTHCTTL